MIKYVSPRLKLKCIFFFFIFPHRLLNDYSFSISMTRIVRLVMAHTHVRVGVQPFGAVSRRALQVRSVVAQILVHVAAGFPQLNRSGHDD